MAEKGKPLICLRDLSSEYHVLVHPTTVSVCLVTAGSMYFVTAIDRWSVIVIQPM